MIVCLNKNTQELCKYFSCGFWATRISIFSSSHFCSIWRFNECQDKWFLAIQYLLLFFFLWNKINQYGQIIVWFCSCFVCLFVCLFFNNFCELECPPRLVELFHIKLFSQSLRAKTKRKCKIKKFQLDFIYSFILFFYFFFQPSRDLFLMVHVSFQDS